MMTISSLNSMTLAEAKEILAGIGYRTDWLVQELVAATPADMRDNVGHALRILAAANLAEADALEAEGQPDD